MLALGRLYVQGLGVLQDYVEAHKWLNLAASRGEVAMPCTERDALAAKMTPQQIATAQERAASWRPESSAAADSSDAGDAPEAVAASSASASPSPSSAVTRPASRSPSPPAATPSASLAPPPSPPPPPHAIREAQALLAALGYAPGPADGKWGPRSDQAYRAFVRDAGLPAAEMLTPDVLREMRRIAARHGATPSPALAAAPEPDSRRAATASGDILHRAAKAGDIEVLNALLAAGADVDGRDDRGWTALMHAVNTGQGPVTERLLAWPGWWTPTFGHRTARRRSFIAVSRGYPEIVALLRNAGADPWLAGPNGRTAAQVARAGGNAAVVEALRLPRQRGEVFRDCADCPEMVVVQEGSFLMGSPPDEPGRWNDEGPRHRVRIAKPFAVGRYEVTFAEWDACRRAGGCAHAPGDEGWGRGRPARHQRELEGCEGVRGLAFEEDGKRRTACSANRSGSTRRGRGPIRRTTGARRPARAGRTAGGAGGAGAARRPPRPAASPRTDSGCSTCRGTSGSGWRTVGIPDYTGAPTDGSAWLKPGDCRLRMLRGGSWDDAVVRVRSAIRYWEFADTRRDVIGFQVARTFH